MHISHTDKANAPATAVELVPEVAPAKPKKAKVEAEPTSDEE